MRLSDCPVRNLRGVEIRQTPLVQKHSAEHFPVSAAMALDCLRALQAPGDDGFATSDDWRAVFASLAPILAPIEEVRLTDFDAREGNRIQEVAADLSRWLDAVWYPKGDALCDEFNAAHPGVRHEGKVWAQRQIMVFAEESAKLVGIWGHACLAGHAEAETDAIIAGMSTHDAMRSPELRDAIARQEAARRAAAEAVSGRSVADLVAGMADEPRGATPGS
jgi:hypothetical protein